MPVPKRPSDPAQLAKLVVDMATGEVPNDKDQVLAALSEQEQPTARECADDRQERQGAGCKPDRGAPLRSS